MKKLLLLLCIVGFSSVGHLFAQSLYVDTALSTSFPKTFDSGAVLSLRFHVVSDSFIPGEYINMNYRVKNSPIDTSATFIGSFVLLTTGDSAIITDPYFIIESDSKFFVGNDIVVVWPTGSGGIALVGDSITDSVHVNSVSSGISHISSIKVALNLHPNPAETQLYLNYNTSIIKLEQVRIYDLLGEIMLTKTSSFNFIDITSLTDGLYFIEATTTDNNRYLLQFVKTH